MKSEVAEPDPTVVKRISEDDRAWFEARPHRRHRVRPFVPGEMPGERNPLPLPGRQLFIVIWQLEPGVRMRRMVDIEGEPAAGEHAAARWFALSMQGEVP